MSCVFAPLTSTPNGTPRLSVSIDRLVPSLPRSVGFLPVFFPTQRRFGHRSVHTLPIPLNALEFIVFQERRFPKLAKDARCGPLLKVTMQRTSRTILLGNGFPLAARSQYELPPLMVSAN